MYLVKFSDDGLADAKSLPKNIRNALKKGIRESLAKNPYASSTELHGRLKGYRSFHFRTYRIVFKVYDDLKAIGIVGIGGRLPKSESDIYKKLSALALRGKLAEKVLSTFRGFSAPQS